MSDDTADVGRALLSSVGQGDAKVDETVIGKLAGRCGGCGESLDGEFTGVDAVRMLTELLASGEPLPSPCPECQEHRMLLHAFTAYRPDREPVSSALVTH